MANGSDDTPLYKFTIQRESPVKNGGEPKFTLVPENFGLPVLAVSKPPDTVESTPVCTSAASAPVFSARQYIKCAVPYCNNYFDGQRSEFMGISYFPFPQDPELRQEWISAIELPPDKDPDQMKVCSDHFMNKDFITDVIEVENGSSEAGLKAPEAVELKPGVKPSVKLGAHADKTQKMAEMAVEAWEKNIRTYGSRGKKGGGKSGNFPGLENPLMDTANEIRSFSDAASTSLMETESLDPPIDADVPVISSVGSLNPDDSMSSELSVGSKSQKELDRERANTIGTLLDVVDVDDEEDDMIEELTAQNTAKRTRMTDNRLENTDENTTDTGLINVPALVKLPPRKTITGDSSSCVPSQLPEPAIVPTEDNQTLPSTPDVLPSTSGCPPDPPPRQLRPRPAYNFALKRKRRTKEEMLRKEEEEEWEPTIWRKKSLAKEGYEFDPKRRGKPTISTGASKNMDSSSDEEAIFEELDEGFRIDEPTVNRSLRSTSEKRRRPGPASKTSRPQYVPAIPTSERSSQNGAPEKTLEEILADPSLLVDWAFFKSLLPDLRRMNVKKRDELKTFMLDTLNARIYDGKPITPSVGTGAV